MSGTHLRPWETISSRELVVDPPWLHLFVEQVRLPNGHTVENFYQIHLPQYAVVVALTANGQVVVERQYKHALRKVTLVLPSGGLEVGEEPLAGAQRELREETGYIAYDWHSLGCFVVDGNRGCGRAHIFAAHGAQKIAARNPDKTEALDVVLMTPDDLMRAVIRGEMVLLASVAAVGLVFNLSGR